MRNDSSLFSLRDLTHNAQLGAGGTGSGPWNESPVNGAPQLPNTHLQKLHGQGFSQQRLTKHILLNNEKSIAKAENHLSPLSKKSSNCLNNKSSCVEPLPIASPSKLLIGKCRRPGSEYSATLTMPLSDC
ncbi:hypothetical protein MN608_03877 [Microdochium nivale]|nr:hypothetical protein MN608_03877 [Microdochium nivale]